MANYKIQIKKKNSYQNWDTLYPQTTIDNVLENENSTKTLKEIIDDIKENGGSGGGGAGGEIGSLKYTSQDPATITVGGISAGYIPPAAGIELTDLIYNMLHPYSKPSITILSNPPFGSYEIGNDLKLIALTANVIKKSNPITAIRIKNGASIVTSFTNNIVNGGYFTYTPPSPISITSNTTYTLEVDDGSSTTTISGTFNLIEAMYSGTTSTTPSSATISELNKIIKTKSSQIISFTTSLGHAVFAYPQSYGELTSIIDPNNFECIKGFNKIIITVNNASYYMYYSATKAKLDNFIYKFYF